MRAVVQRVGEASVSVEGREIARIGRGLVVYLGVGRGDGEPEVTWLAEKIANLRIFENDRSHFDQSVLDVGGAALVVSQFTLYGDCRRGRRPSFEAALPPEEAEPLYEKFLAALAAQGVPVQSGRFRAMMDVAAVNAGPVTMLLDSARGF
ncbi:MAG: D-tyrosyl-tRNA(Tyr) deacylase [Deltaproteobacteria bacterium]|nr:D-tyrosyl-tRNA(Tyr) deacylase [Deltaproteobacteria bacterium]